MRNIIVFIPFIFAFNSYCQPFSGVIKYRTTVSINDTNKKYFDYYKGKYGDTLNLEIDRKGLIKRTFIGTKNPGFEFLIIDPYAKNSYNKFTYSDTIFVSDPLIEPTKLIKIDTLGTEEILGRVCDIFKLTIIESRADSSQLWYYTLWLDSETKLNSKIYQDWLEGHWNTISSLNDGMYLKSNLTNNYLNLTYEAFFIEERKIKEIEINPHGKPILLIN